MCFRIYLWRNGLAFSSIRCGCHGSQDCWDKIFLTDYKKRRTWYIQEEKDLIKVEYANMRKDKAVETALSVGEKEDYFFFVKFSLIDSSTDII